MFGNYRSKVKVVSKVMHVYVSYDADNSGVETILSFQNGLCVMVIKFSGHFMILHYYLGQ
jgi:hypothetical protein